MMNTARLTFRVVFFGVLLIALSNVHAWKAPIGIPDPPFGINEVHTMYSGKTFGFSTGTKVYPEAANGPYSYYIDNTHPDATDSNNPYGTSDKPRVTIPKNISEPGAVVEIHGGPYTVGYLILRLTGTESQPIFVRGISKTNRPLFKDGTLYIAGSYAIVENIELSNVPVGIRTFKDESVTHHICIRGFNAYNLDKSGFKTHSDDTALLTNNVVYYDNYIHSDLYDPQNPPASEDDDVGIYLASGSSHVWIIDNEICTFKGDAVGGGHGVNYTAKNYYIGRNDLHTCRENAFDFKEVENIVVSQNKLHDCPQGIGVVHYGPRYSPKNVWIIANEFYNAVDCGFQVGGDQRYDVYVIGNIFRDITNENGTAVGYRTWNCEGVFLINNVFYNVDKPIKSDVSSSVGYLVLQNCIISKINSQSYFFEISGSSHMEKCVISNNIFYQEGDNVRVSWGGDVLSLGEFKSKSGKGENCIQTDPLFVDAENNDFNLINRDSTVSPGIDAGVTTVYDSLFHAFFGIELSKDFEGKKRPVDGDDNGSVRYDIGCFEHSGIKNNSKPATGIFIE